jgi:hypothetical protein
MNRPTISLTLLVLLLAPAGLFAEQPETPPPGMGLYVMALWPPGAPHPSDPPGKGKDRPEPDVAKLGGRLLQKIDSRRIVMLPLGVAKQLRRDEAVASGSGWGSRWKGGTRPMRRLREVWFRKP